MQIFLVKKCYTRLPIFQVSSSFFSRKKMSKNSLLKKFFFCHFLTPWILIRNSVRNTVRKKNLGGDSPVVRLVVEFVRLDEGAEDAFVA